MLPINAKWNEKKQKILSITPKLKFMQLIFELSISTEEKKQIEIYIYMRANNLPKWTYLRLKEKEKAHFHLNF